MNIYLGSSFIHQIKNSIKIYQDYIISDYDNTCLVHNDFIPENILINKIIPVIPN